MKIKLFIITILLVSLLPICVSAQPQPDGNDVDTPIDGGISLLVAAGAIVGAKKIRDSRKK